MNDTSDTNKDKNHYPPPYLQRGVNIAVFRHKPITFLCIGTDRSTGDSFGPWVGTFLQSRGYPHVLGTLNDPVHALNLHDRVKTIPPDHTVIAIDSALGNYHSIGKIIIDSGPLYPGAGVGKKLGAHGDYHITGIVNIGGFMEYFILQNTRLSLVMDMVELTVQEIETCLPLAVLEIATVTETSSRPTFTASQIDALWREKLQRRASLAFFATLSDHP